MFELPDNFATTAKKIDTEGYLEIPMSVSDKTLKNARNTVDRYIEEYGNRYFSVHGIALKTQTFGEIIRNEEFDQFLRTVSGCGLGREIEKDVAIHTVLRVITGEEGNKQQAYNFHYDASVITALMPVYIPENDEGGEGDLLLIPNARPFRKSILMNLYEKTLLQNGLRSKLLRKQSVFKKLGGVSLKIKPGNLYLFWGYRTIHANEPFTNSQVRATAIFHLGDPHGQSWVTRSIVALRKRIEANRIKRQPSANGSTLS